MVAAKPVPVKPSHVLRLTSLFLVPCSLFLVPLPPASSLLKKHRPERQHHIHINPGNFRAADLGKGGGFYKLHRTGWKEEGHTCIDVYILCNVFDGRQI